jgi:hypothetical protein
LIRLRAPQPQRDALGLEGEVVDGAPDYSLEFDPAGDVVITWARDDGKRRRRMIAEVQEHGIQGSTAL